MDSVPYFLENRRIHFHVLGIPQPQGSSRAFVPKGWTRPVVTSANPSLKGWRQNVAATAQLYAPEHPFVGAVSLRLVFWLRRPQSLPKRITAMVKKPDLDKLTRAICDALEGVIYVRDSQVTELFAVKAYAAADQVPCVDITVQET